MPDISMCQNETCPLRDKCFRFMATPSRYQSYSMFEWEHLDHELGKVIHCNDFFKITNPRSSSVKESD